MTDRPLDRTDDDAVANEGYAKALGARLRAIRMQQHLSLHGVERKSGGKWKAVVVGSYERGDRAVSVQRLADLADFYGVPVSDLLPPDDSPFRMLARLPPEAAASRNTGPACDWTVPSRRSPFDCSTWISSSTSSAVSGSK